MSCTIYVIHYSKVGSIYVADYSYTDCTTLETVSNYHTSHHPTALDNIYAVTDSVVVNTGVLGLDPPMVYPTPTNTGNILLNTPFNTTNDFTVSFTYTLNTSGTDANNLYGFSLFFIDGSINNLMGGGYGPGLGVVPTTGSAVNGVFAIVGFDIAGYFSQFNSIPSFASGTANIQPNSVAVRTGSSFNFVGYNRVLNNPNMFVSGYNQTIRVCVRKNFTEIDVYYVNNLSYIKIGTYNFNLFTLPSTAKVGIGYSGDPYFQVQNITVNQS